MDKALINGRIKPIIPKLGGGLSQEVHLLEYNGKKFVFRKCKNIKVARKYVLISKYLSRYGIIPKLINRFKENVFYEFLPGRDLRRNESLEIFFEVGKICGIINKISPREKINNLFERQLIEITTGKYKKYTLKELMEKKKRRPNERYDKRRIKALITLKQKEEMLKINLSLLNKTKARIRLDAFDVSPANFRISNKKVYFVDIGAIQPKLECMGLAKGLFGWAKTDKQKNALIKGYESISKKPIREDLLDLVKLHYLIQSIHDRVKLGRDYSIQLKMLNDFLGKRDIIEEKR